MAEKIWILDTTLRDGEQAPGCLLVPQKKLELARSIARLGVDVLEAGFPAVSKGEAEAVRMIAREIGQGSEELTPIICALARGTVGDIEQAWRAVREAQRPRIHISLPTSDIHLRHKLRIDRSTLLCKVRDMVGHARARCEDVEFGAEDASRTEPEFLCRVFEEAIRAGARSLNIPDTVGRAMPETFAALVRKVMVYTPGIERAMVSVHCHDDLGLATANTLAGVRAGARQVEVTINGIGERAGNASLEEVVVALSRAYDFETGIALERLVPTSHGVSRCTGIVVPANKAIVGANAFAHQSGIHQDGLLKHPETYESLAPETVGAPPRRLVLGKHSGRHALFARMAQRGLQVPEVDRDDVFVRFKALADERREVRDEDLPGLLLQAPSACRVENLCLVGGESGASRVGHWKASVTLRYMDQLRSAIAEAVTGPEAVVAAISMAMDCPILLAGWRVSATGGMHRCEVELDAGEPLPWSASAEAQDPMMALAKACVDACVGAYAGTLFGGGTNRAPEKSMILPRSVSK